MRLPILAALWIIEAAEVYQKDDSVQVFVNKVSVCDLCDLYSHLTHSRLDHILTHMKPTTITHCPFADPRRSNIGR